MDDLLKNALDGIDKEDVVPPITSKRSGNGVDKKVVKKVKKEDEKEESKKDEPQDVDGDKENDDPSATNRKGWQWAPSQGGYNNRYNGGGGGGYNNRYNGGGGGGYNNRYNGGGGGGYNNNNFNKFN